SRSQNLDQLQNIFYKNHYHQLDLNNHIPIIISQQDLTITLQKLYKKTISSIFILYLKKGLLDSKVVDYIIQTSKSTFYY
ncbi:hypothetical protein N7528_006576, partial [Penicillium herquei]